MPRVKNSKDWFFTFFLTSVEFCLLLIFGLYGFLAYLDLTHVSNSSNIVP
jgi:hypothetical protein